VRRASSSNRHGLLRRGHRRAARSAADDAPRPVVESRAYGYWELVWIRFKRDRVAVASGLVALLVILVCFVGEPVAEHLLGHGPNDIYPMAVDIELHPAPAWTRVPDVHGVVTVTPDTPRTLFVLGADGVLGRDLFLRVLDGGRTSLEVAIGAAALAVLLGVVVGLLAGYYGGWIDAVVTRMTEFVMGFPILLFLIAIGWTISEKVQRITFDGALAPGVVSLVLIIGLFSWFYPARIVRAQALALREQEFVEAARMVGAGDVRILRKHLLPHLVGTIVVYGALMIATTIFLEAALSILNVGIELPAATWGNLIATNYGTLLSPGGPSAFGDSQQIKTAYLATLWPTICIFVSVLAFNLLGEGIRQAVDPRLHS
jgi:peptide/nickel transport system permease protein